MISETQVREALQEMLGVHAPKDYPYAVISDNLSLVAREKRIRLSAYGFFKWSIERYGTMAMYKNICGSLKAAEAYGTDAEEIRDSMQSLLINASEYVAAVFGTIADKTLRMEKLEDMSVPYVLYIFFAAGGQEVLVQKYRKDAEEQLRRYPCLLDKLPDIARKIEEVLHATAQGN